MASVTIKRAVAVQVIVTERYKQEVTEELGRAIQEAEQEISRVEMQARRLLSGVQTLDLQQTMGIRRQLEAEKQRLEGFRQELTEQIEEVQKWELDTEKSRGSLESTTEIKEGDDLWKRLRDTQIVVKDGVVVGIREG
jgi:DNA repair exonuclease SbcCD ATPase subunit